MGTFFLSRHSILAASSLLIALVLVISFKKLVRILGKDGTLEHARRIEGAPRAVFPVFTVLILWASFIFLLPMTLGFREEIISASSSQAKLIVTAKILFAPFIFLIVISYATRRNFLNWIQDLKWPNNDADN